MRFGDVVALDQIDLTLTADRRVALVGRSGCGKTTLMRVLAGLITPTTGTRTFRDARGRLATPRVGFVFQNATLLPWATVWKNVVLPKRLGTSPARLDATAREQAVELLRSVQLGDVADRYPGELSGGMQMRVSLARALAAEPDVLLLDEPFAALDDLLREQLGESITRVWRQRKCMVVLVTHHLRDAVLLTDDIVLIDRGRVITQLANPLSASDPAARRDEPAGWSFGNELQSRLRAAAS